MGDKVQGEGDYESARRYNKHTAESARKGVGKIPVREADQQDRNAEESGKRRAKELKHDQTDADLMKEPVDRHSTK